MYVAGLDHPQVSTRQHSLVEVSSTNRIGPEPIADCVLVGHRSSAWAGSERIVLGSRYKFTECPLLIVREYRLVTCKNLSSAEVTIVILVRRDDSNLSGGLHCAELYRHCVISLGIVGYNSLTFTRSLIESVIGGSRFPIFL